MKSDYIYNKNFTIRKNCKELINFLKFSSNVEVGGYRIYDGAGDHCLQCPEEIVWLINQIQNLEKKNHYKMKSFLEFGFANGVTNTILSKTIKFDKIVAVDIVAPQGISKEMFFANLRFKNITLLCGNSKSHHIKNNIEHLGKYDLIFIDGGHEYDTVRSDYELSLKLISKKGLIVIHDIGASTNVFNGPQKLWKEIKSKNKKQKYKEFICKKYHTIYGMGIMYDF